MQVDKSVIAEIDIKEPKTPTDRRTYNYKWIAKRTMEVSSYKPLEFGIFSFVSCREANYLIDTITNN